MSTNIVVDVALAALRQLNQAQVTANRQAKLLADRNAKLAQKAVDAETVAKAQQGQSLDGAMLYGVKSDRRRPQADPVPASRRASGSGWLLVPRSASFTPFVGGIDPFTLSLDTLEQPGFRPHEMTFASVGPLGLGAFHASTIPVAGITTADRYQSALIGNSSIRQEPSNKQLTLEAIVKLPDIPFSECNVVFGGFRLQMRQDPPVNYARFSVGLYPVGTRVIYDTSPGAIDPGNIVVPGVPSTGVFHHLAIVQDPGSSASTRTYSFYLDGMRYFQLVDFDITPPYGPVWNSDPSSNDIRLSSDSGSIDGIPSNSFPTIAHGIRFTPRALYSGASFTPPTSITSLA